VSIKADHPPYIPPYRPSPTNLCHLTLLESLYMSMLFIPLSSSRQAVSSPHLLLLQPTFAASAVMPVLFSPSVVRPETEGSAAANSVMVAFPDSWELPVGRGSDRVGMRPPHVLG
jgi:hypothetical protein